MLLIVPAFYGAVTLGVLLLTFQGRDRDARGAAIVLALLYVLTNICQVFVHHPYNQFYPILDGATAAALIWFWRWSLRPWKAALICFLLVDVLIHVGYFRAGDTGHDARYVYDLRLNLVFLAQWVCVVCGVCSNPWERWRVRRGP